MKKKQTKDTHKWGWNILKWAFIIGPITAGIDKWLKLIADWPGYIAPQFAKMIPLSASQLMQAVGGLEIIAGVIVWWKPRIGGFLVGGWITLIVVNLVIGGYYAEAFRDSLIAVAAYSFGMMTVKK